MALKFLNVDLITRRLGNKTAEELSGQTVGTAEYDAWATTEGELAEGDALGYVTRRYDVGQIDFTGEATALNVWRANLLDILYERTKGARFTLSESEEKAAERARKYFREIGDGKIAVPSSSEPAASSAADTKAEVSGPEREYTRETMEGL